MIVVADTSSINYLALIEAVEVLPELYQNVIIPRTLFEKSKIESRASSTLNLAVSFKARVAE
jgi:predicted nucleic acid-binding protein